MNDRNRDLVWQLVRKVPELSEEDGWDGDVPYAAFGILALLICRRIRDGATVEFLDRAFALLNEMALSSDKYELDLLCAGALEIFIDDPVCFSVAEANLNEPGKDLLRKTRDAWNRL